MLWAKIFSNSEIYKYKFNVVRMRVSRDLLTSHVILLVTSRSWILIRLGGRFLTRALSSHESESVHLASLNMHDVTSYTHAQCDILQFLTTHVFFILFCLHFGLSNFLNFCFCYRVNVKNTVFSTAKSSLYCLYLWIEYITNLRAKSVRYFLWILTINFACRKLLVE